MAVAPYNNLEIAGCLTLCDACEVLICHDWKIPMEHQAIVQSTDRQWLIRKSVVM